MNPAAPQEKGFKCKDDIFPKPNRETNCKKTNIILVNMGSGFFFFTSDLEKENKRTELGP